MVIATVAWSRVMFAWMMDAEHVMSRAYMVEIW